ncbi:MAG TPA: hypothetical protein VKA70_20180 [Blastocatellia bacterium]|nr:hypothetical protein [Blastocatellia bacterium]
MSENIERLDINRIEVRLKTAAGQNSGTNGIVFLAVAGREFRLGAGFAPGSTKTIILGEGATVPNPQFNEPRDLIPLGLRSGFLQIPAWIRLEGSDDWQLESVDVTINPGVPLHEVKYEWRLQPGKTVWLGPDTGGRYAFLTTRFPLADSV